MAMSYEGADMQSQHESSGTDKRVKRYDLSLELSFQMDSDSPDVDDTDVLKQLIAKLKEVTKDRNALKSSITCTAIRDRFSLDEDNQINTQGGKEMPF